MHDTGRYPLDELAGRAPDLGSEPGLDACRNPSAAKILDGLSVSVKERGDDDALYSLQGVGLLNLLLQLLSATR